MGSKVNPVGQRIGITRSWDSSWYASKQNYGDFLLEDLKIREHVMKALPDCGIASIQLKRNAKDITLDIYSSKPGIIIGRQGSGVEGLKEELERKFKYKFTINVKEVKQPELEASLVAENIAMQIERRVSYRRAAKMAVQRAMENGAKGVKIKVSGRLNGVEIARSEQYSEGQVPLHTFRADIDYATATAVTTYGAIGIKVWVNRGLIFNSSN